MILKKKTRRRIGNNFDFSSFHTFFTFSSPPSYFILFHHILSTSVFFFFSSCSSLFSFCFLSSVLPPSLSLFLLRSSFFFRFLFPVLLFLLFFVLDFNSLLFVQSGHNIRFFKRRLGKEKKKLKINYFI